MGRHARAPIDRRRFRLTIVDEVGEEEEDEEEEDEKKKERKKKKGEF